MMSRQGDADMPQIGDSDGSSNRNNRADQQSLFLVKLIVDQSNQINESSLDVMIQND